MTTRPQIIPYVLPLPTPSTGGPLAAWVGAWGIARSAADMGDFEVRVVSPAGTLTVDDLPAILGMPKKKASGAPAEGPSAAGRAARDVKQWLTMKRFARYATGEVRRLAQRADIPYVLTRHVLFGSAGRDASRAVGRPLVTWVHAALVHEADTWGTKRPFAPLVEQVGERRLLAHADGLVGVTQNVFDDLGLAGDPRTAVIGNGTELSRFKGSPKRKKQIVWVGSFRKFHGVERVVRAFHEADVDAELVLVGRGSQLPVIEALVAELGIAHKVKLPGFVAPADLPDILLRAQVGVVAAGLKSEDFHYSPVKLREYAAAGLVGVVPNIGEMAGLADEPWIVAYENTDAGLVQALRDGLKVGAKAASHKAARTFATTHYGWDRWWERTSALVS